MTRFGRRRADDLDRLLSRRAPVSAGPTPGSPGSPEELAAVVARLRAAAPDLAAASRPRPAFRAALRTRLVAVAAVQGEAVQGTRRTGRQGAVPAPPSRPLLPRRTATLLVGTLAVALVAAGVGVSADRALPGDPFYGVKRAAEGVSLRTADGPLDRGVTHLHHASERLDELRRLTEQGRTALGPTGPGRVLAASPREDRVRGLLADMDRDTTTGNGLVLRAVARDRDQTPLSLLTVWAGQQGSLLAGLVPDLPLGAQARAQSSLAVVEGVRTGAAELLSRPPAAPQPSPTPS